MEKKVQVKVMEEECQETVCDVESWLLWETKEERKIRKKKESGCIAHACKSDTPCARAVVIVFQK